MGVALANKNINSRSCSACQTERHIRFFPLVYPDDPLDFRRLTICEPCFRKAKKVYKDTPAYKAMVKEKRLNSRRGYKAEMAAYRAIIQKKATPIWADADQIERIYLEAKALSMTTGIKYHVDHIVPLVHRHVCGLHVPANLQVLTQAENCAKSNRYEV